MNSTPVDSIDETWSNEGWMIPYLFILLIMGTIGNSFGILVFLNSSMQKYSCSLYFLLMSIFDELTLFVWITNRLSGELTSTPLRNRSNIFCKLFVVVYYSSAQSSIGMLVLATFDRLYTTFKIAHGYFEVRLVIRRRRFQQICLSIFFLILIGFNALLFGSQLVLPPDSDDASCVIINRYINRIYSIIDLCVYAIIPCISMLLGDILILYYIQKTRARIISISDVNKQREKQLSIMLVITTIVSLFIVSPYSILNLLINFSNILDDDYRTLYTLNDVFGLLSTFTHAMHFYLFLIISCTIRKHFRILWNSFIKICLNTRNVIQPAVIPTVKTTTSSRPALNIIQRIPNFQTIK
jgi:hypothetical protein